MWNAVEYFKDLNTRLKLTRGKHVFCRSTGLAHLEDLLSRLQKYQNFTVVDDSDDGVTIRKGGGYFNRRSVIVYVLKKYNYKSQEDRQEKLNEVRVIYTLFISRLLRDSNIMPELAYLDKTRIPYHELPGYFVAGTTGLYFIITIDEPVNLQFDGDDWDEQIIFDPTFDETFS
jgi:hypothetical protein